MKLIHNYSLKKHNTFGMDVFCKVYSEVKGDEQLKDVLSNKLFDKYSKLIIGGGSNILFTKDYEGLIINQVSDKIEILEEDEKYAIISADAGVVWDDFVKFCVNKNFGGIENLSMIPGKVGAAPIQNIGAYGQELSETFYSLKGIFIDDFREHAFGNSECMFGYRESIFKKQLKNNFVITQITLRLNKNPKINISYHPVASELLNSKIENPTIKDVSNVISLIRKNKLPDPNVIGNAGSFFKNPEVDEKKYSMLKEKFGNVPSYIISEKRYKLPAAWLIEQCGFKGKKNGSVGVHEKQALVIVNYGNGKPIEIINLKNEILLSVKEKFNIDLEAEVNII